MKPTPTDKVSAETYSSTDKTAKPSSEQEPLPEPPSPNPAQGSGGVPCSPTVYHPPPGPELPPRSARLSPDVVQNYELLELLGRGAMGEVYKARNLWFDRLEALKRISADLGANPQARGSFRQEMRNLSRLNHPGIVQVYYASEFDGDLFFTMSLEKTDLMKLLSKEGPLPPSRAATLLQQIAEAIDYAHHHKIVHRDLKPSNVLLTEAGVPRVSDFGLALLMVDEGGRRQGGVVGTPSYMPPEQAKGAIKDVGERSDVYSLGAILYEMLTGRPPFEGETVEEILRKVREEEPVAPREKSPNVPRPLEAICLKCLRKDPADRYASAGQLARALKDYLHPAWRRRLGVGLALAVVLGVASFLIGNYAVTQYQLRGDAEALVKKVEDREKNKERQPLQDLQDFSEAEQKYAQLLGKRVLLFDRTEVQLKRLKTILDQGEVLRQLRRFPEGIQLLELAVKELEEMRAKKPDHARCLALLADTYHTMGTLHNDQDLRAELEKAKDRYGKALEIRVALYNKDPNNAEYQRDLALSYGYLGDAQLELDEWAEAQTSYENAKKLRKILAEAEPHEDNLCYHARDFANLCFLYDWQGQPQEAIHHLRARKSYYEKHHLKLILPGKFLTEHLTTYLDLAELQLDQPAPLDPEVGPLLKEALKGYQELYSASPQDNPEPQIVAGLARVHVALGKYYFLRDQNAEARSHLGEAQVLLYGLLGEGKATADDLYRLARTHALMSRMEKNSLDRGREQGFALSYLKAAVRRGFKHIKRLDRDCGFELLKQSETERFEEIREKILEQRRLPQSNRG